MSEPNSAPAWVVDSQTQRTKADAAGNVADGYDVHFHTRQGHYGTVFVVMARYTPANVAAAVAEHAALLDAVGSLTGGA